MTVKMELSVEQFIDAVRKSGTKLQFAGLSSAGNMKYQFVPNWLKMTIDGEEYSAAITIVKKQGKG